MLLLLALACLTNEDLYDQRRALLTDQDGDGITEEQGDCDDKDANRFPGGPELCDGEDDDCDTVIDEEGVDTFWYTDIDGDTFGDPLSEVESCQSPGESDVQDKADCNDRDPAIHPGIEETCDGVDEDCNGTMDDAPIDPTTGHLDQDGDGITEEQGDCDDNHHSNRFPGAPERNNNRDKDKNTRTVAAPIPTPRPVRAPAATTSTPWATPKPPPFAPRSHHQSAQSAPQS